MFDEENEENPKKVVRKTGVVMVGVSALPEVRLEMIRGIECQGMAVAVVKDEDLLDEEKLERLAGEVRKLQRAQNADLDFVLEIQDASLQECERLTQEASLLLNPVKERHFPVKEIKKPVRRQDFNNMAKMRRQARGR